MKRLTAFFATTGFLLGEAAAQGPLSCCTGHGHNYSRLQLLANAAIAASRVAA
jgi:hypothetical protein